MKILVCTLMMILALSLVGCSETPDNADSNALGAIPENYTLENARKDKCLVMENGDVTCGQEVFDEFLNQTKKGEYASIRVVDYYELPDPSHYAEEYYEEIKDDYPLMYIRDIVYENGKYMEFFREDAQLMMREFSYLVEDHFTALSTSARVTGGTAFFLCDRDDVSYHDVFQSAFSSQANDFIPFSVIYQLNSY